MEAPPKEKEEAPKVEKPKKPAVSAYSSGKLEKFGTQTEKAKVIYVFRNGDKHHIGYKFTVHATKYKSWDQVSEEAF